MSMMAFHVAGFMMLRVMSILCPRSLRHQHRA
jgi:hypothetical protein